MTEAMVNKFKVTVDPEFRAADYNLCKKKSESGFIPLTSTDNLQLPLPCQSLIKLLFSRVYLCVCDVYSFTLLYPVYNNLAKLQWLTAKCRANAQQQDRGRYWH